MKHRRKETLILLFHLSYRKDVITIVVSVDKTALRTWFTELSKFAITICRKVLQLSFPSMILRFQERIYPSSLDSSKPPEINEQRLLLEKH